MDPTLYIRRGRNSEIEVSRFLFAVEIMLCHYALVYGYRFFSRGAIGVEFFLLLSGLLMGHSANRLTASGRVGSIGNASWVHLRKKISVFYPYYLFAIAFSFLFVRTILAKNVGAHTFVSILKGIPQYLMLEMSGAYVGSPVGISGRWYLSAMVLATAILFPILLRLGDYAKKILFPLIGVFGLGYLQQNYGGIMDSYVWNGFAGLGLINALAQISLGAAAYELARRLSQVEFTTLGKVALTCVKAGCYLAAFLYGNDSLAVEPLIIVLLLLPAIVLSYSRAGYSLCELHGCDKLFLFLGKISLPLYVMHVPIGEMVQTLVGKELAPRYVPYMIVLSLVTAIALPALIEALGKGAGVLRRCFIRG